MNSLAVRARTISDRIALAAGLDVRLLGMLSVMAAVWLALHVLTGGLFLTPRNLFNLSLQVSVNAFVRTSVTLRGRAGVVARFAPRSGTRTLL